MLLRAQRARQQRHTDSERSTQLVDREEVLLGERLGRRHQRALAAQLHRPEQRVQCNDGLPRPDLALEETLHRKRPVEVGVDLGHRAFLIRGERERERRAVAGNELARLAERLRRCTLTRGGRTQESEPEDQELVECEPRPPDLGFRERTRTMHDRQRVRSSRQAFGCEQRSGKLFPDVEHPFERLLVEVTELLLRDVLGGGIDRREVARLRLAVQVVRRHGEAMSVRTAADSNGRARHELRLEPRLVEPRRLDLPRLVRDACREDLQPTAAAARRGAHDAFDDGVLVAEEIADPLRRNGLLVPARTLPEQIADRQEAELPEPTRDRRADPLERLDRRVEQVGPGRRPRPRPALGRRHPSEADRQRNTCNRPHHNRRAL